MGGAAIPQLMKQNPIIAIGPEHADLLVSHNWSKEDFRKVFWENTRTPLSAWPMACRNGNLVELLGPLEADSLIPITLKPGQMIVVMAGGSGKQSHYFAPMPGALPVSRAVG